MWPLHAIRETNNWSTHLPSNLMQSTLPIRFFPTFLRSYEVNQSKCLHYLGVAFGGLGLKSDMAFLQ